MITTMIMIMIDGMPHPHSLAVSHVRHSRNREAHASVRITRLRSLVTLCCFPCRLLELHRSKPLSKSVLVLESQEARVHGCLRCNCKVLNATWVLNHWMKGTSSLNPETPVKDVGISFLPLLVHLASS